MNVNDRIRATAEGFLAALNQPFRYPGEIKRAQALLQDALACPQQEDVSCAGYLQNSLEVTTWNHKCPGSAANKTVLPSTLKHCPQCGATPPKIQVPVVRALTEGEITDCYGNKEGDRLAIMIQRKFAEVNGLIIKE